MINFFVRAWFLLPPTNERTIFFWFAKFYQDLFFPSLAFLSIGIFSIALWLSQITDSPREKILVPILGIVASIICLFPAFGTYAFIATSYVFQDIKQNGYYYYIVGYYDEMAVEYFFCKSGELGFSGKCEYINWDMVENTKPKLSIDTNTQYVVVEFEEPHYYWVNSEPPICVANLGEIRNTENLLNNECPP